jgi:CheY-like chemotaxis protein
MALILIVDDALISRTVIRKTLIAENHKTLEAANGTQALEMIHSYQPDCILLDLLLPAPNGLEILKILQAENSPIPVIVITADTQETARQKCLSFGAKAVLYKPPKPGELLELINQNIPDQKEPR